MILLIDDDYIRQELIKDDLIEAGLENLLVIAYDKKTAKEAIDKHWKKLMLIITDMRLPEDIEMSDLPTKEICYEIGKYLKNKMNISKKEIPIILMTVYGDEIQQEFREKTGLQEKAFFQKPFASDLFMKKVIEFIPQEKNKIKDLK